MKAFEARVDKHRQAKEELQQKELLQNRIIELENSEKLGSEEIERQNIMLDKSEKSNAKLIHATSLKREKANVRTSFRLCLSD